MPDSDSFFHHVTLRHQIRLNEAGTEALVRPLLELELDRAAVLMIAQSIDGMEMFPPTRYPLDKGVNSFFLKTLRVVNPQQGEYEFSVEIEASGVAKSTFFERILLKK